MGGQIHIWCCISNKKVGTLIKKRSDYEPVGPKLISVR